MSLAGDRVVVWIGFCGRKAKRLPAWLSSQRFLHPSIHPPHREPPHCAHQTLHPALATATPPEEAVQCMGPFAPALAHPLLFWGGGVLTALNNYTLTRHVPPSGLLVKGLFCWVDFMCRFFIFVRDDVDVLQNRRVQFTDILSKKCRFGPDPFCCLLTNKLCTPPLPPTSSSPPPRDFSPGIYAKHALVSLAELKEEMDWLLTVNNV